MAALKADDLLTLTMIEGQKSAEEEKMSFLRGLGALFMGLIGVHLTGRLRSPYRARTYNRPDFLRGQMAPVSFRTAPEGLYVTIQTIVLGITYRNGVEDRQILDICEGELLLVHWWSVEEASEEFILGWLLAVQHLLDNCNGEEIVDLRPWHLGSTKMFQDVLALKTPQSEEDYQDRFLVKSRLGRWLPRGETCKHCLNVNTGKHCTVCGERHS